MCDGVPGGGVHAAWYKHGCVESAWYKHHCRPPAAISASALQDPRALHPYLVM
jgi:hypothetical protein